MSNIKFDRITAVTWVRDDQDSIDAILPDGLPFVVLASVRREEEHEVKKIIQEVMRHRPEAIIGLFPRHLHRTEFWQNTLARMNRRWSLRSTVSKPVPAGTVIIWDTFGELEGAYQFAKSAFVGGSLAPLGGQNFLEPLVSGIIPIIGPSWENFAWVGPAITDANLLRVAGDWETVAALILKDLDNAPPRTEVTRQAFQFVNTRQGGTDQACRQIEAMLFGK